MILFALLGGVLVLVLVYIIFKAEGWSYNPTEDPRQHNFKELDDDD